MSASWGYLVNWKGVRDVCAVCGILFLVLGVTPLQLHAQRLSLSVEASGGWSAVRSNGITDPGVPRDLVAYADHWLGQQVSAASGGVRLVVDLPVGLGAFVGYHVTEFRQVADSTLHENLYGSWLYSWDDVESFTGSSRTEGMEVGLTFTPSLHWTGMQPFVSVGIRQEEFRSSTILEATAVDVVAVTSQSKMTAGADWGPLVAGGIVLPLGHLALGLRIEHGQADPPVTARRWEKEFVRPDGSDGRVGADLTVPDGQTVRLRYYRVMLGLRWRIF